MAKVAPGIPGATFGHGAGWFPAGASFQALVPWITVLHV